MIWLLGALALLGVNVLTFLAFWLDKRRSRAGEWRISESNLLGSSLIGGTPAAFYACHRLRHKTRKEPFGTQLGIIAMFQSGMLGGVAIYQWL